VIVFLLVVAFIAWFVYLCVTWGRPPKKRKHYHQSLAPLPPSQPLTPEQIALVVVLAQTLAQPHHH
jgi:hypothetical protein